MKIKKILCNIMTRTVGYYANYDQMNRSKQEEVRQRKLYHANKKFKPGSKDAK